MGADPEPGTPDPVVDREAFRARCGAWDRQRQFDTAYGFGTFLLDGTLVGEVSLGSVQRGPFQSCFIGYWIDERYAGCGYMPDAVAIVLRYGFEELRLHRMEAAIVPRNAKSRRVAAKLGLRDEGTATRFLQIQGVWEDHVRYAITREEWDERRERVRGAVLLVGGVTLPDPVRRRVAPPRELRKKCSTSAATIAPQRLDGK